MENHSSSDLAAAFPSNHTKKAAISMEGTAEADPDMSAPSTSSQRNTFEYRASVPSDEGINVDSEIHKMIAAAEKGIATIQAEEFPSRKRCSKQSRWSERAVPFPLNNVKRIMKFEEFVRTELERRACDTRADCGSSKNKCSDASGSCSRHPPKQLNFAAECGLLMGKAAELFERELAIRSYHKSVEQGKIVIQRDHLSEGIANVEMFDFLIDIVPAPSTTASVKRASKSNVQESVTGDMNVTNYAAQAMDASAPITVGQAAAQLGMLKNLVQLQQQQHSHRSDDHSFFFSL